MSGMRIFFRAACGFLISAVWAATSAAAADVTFFSYSDSHYVETDTAGKAAVGIINTLAGTAYPAAIGGVMDEPRGVIMQGDLINDGALAAKYPTQWANYIADFGVNGEGRCIYPVFEGLGNHDVNDNLYVLTRIKERNVIRKNLGHIQNVSSNGYHYSWDWDGIHFVNANLFGGNIWNGEADAYGSAHHPQYARDFLVEDLEKNVGDTGRPVVYIQHFRPVDENWWTHSAADKLHKVLQNYNVIVLLVGHQGGGVNNTWRGFNWVSSNGAVTILGVTPDNRFFAVARTGTTWGTPFIKNIYLSYATSGLPAVINNGDWVLNASAHNATVSGKILYEAVPSSEVTVYWGTSDGGTTAGNWHNSKAIGVQDVGEVFSTKIEGLQPWTTYYYRCRVTNSKGSAWAAASIPFTTRGFLPSGWRTDFIGYEQRAWGGAADASGVIAMRGSGRDIGESSIDNFQYSYVSLEGDGEIKARVTSMTVDSREPKVGVMMRESLAANARYASMLICSISGSKTVKWYARTSTGGGTTKSGTSVVSTPYWVRLTRSGNTFTGYLSADGGAWTQVGTPVTMNWPAQMQVGLAVTAGNRDGSKNHNASFDSVTVTGNTAVGYEHWRSQQFPSEDVPDDWVSGRGVDPDDDGVTNEGEYVSDTRPRDMNSRLEITGVRPHPGGGWQVDWKGGTAARQIVEARTGLDAAGGAWVPVFTNQPPTGSDAAFLDPATGPDLRFYRIRAERR